MEKTVQCRRQLGSTGPSAVHIPGCINNKTLLKWGFPNITNREMRGGKNAAVRPNTEREVNQKITTGELHNYGRTK